jgi:predicted glycogen debranching enzyme
MRIEARRERWHQSEHAAYAEAWRARRARAKLDAMIEFGAEICRDFKAATKKEWLETNGIGGYASSTIILTNTRRYHGCLVVARTPPASRAVLLAKLDESLILRGDRFDLHTNQYSDAIQPAGHQYLERVRLDPYPIFTYRVPGGLLEKSLFLVHGEHTLVVIYRFSGEAPALIEVRPLVAYRGFHDLAHENESLNRVPDDRGGVLVLTPFAGMPPLSIAHGGTFRSEGYWYKSFEYVEEAFRGYSFREDLYSYGAWTRTLEPGREVALVVSTADAASMDALRLREVERARRAEIAAGAAAASSASGAAPELAQTLRLAADQFIVRGSDKLTAVLGGYPWFPEGARDAAIALPGLTLATGRYAYARDVIRHLLMRIEGGLLPASFLEERDGGAPPPPSVDSILWLIVAVHEYLRATDDRAFVANEVAAPIVSALDALRHGSTPRARVDGDGLLVIDGAGTPLTWMNARVGDWVATERAGMPVEVCALWVNALAIGSELAAIAGERDQVAALGAESERARAAFERAFWDENTGFLRDTVGGDASTGGALRPNQIIALGLPHPVLGAAESRRALETVRAKLWTPFGIRTLSPDDSQYRGRYIGDTWLREKAYHQGSAWPWLFGAYVRACLRVEGAAGAAHARECVSFLEAHVRDAGIGTVSELFDGDAPHSPRGAIASAIGVAECLRALDAIASA